MRRLFVQLILMLILVTIISACNPFVTSTPPPSPQPIQVTFTSSLRPWTETLHQCALERPEIALIIEETSASALDFSSEDLTLWFGEPPQDFLGYAATLGQDEIIIIAGTDVTLRNLTREDLTELYSQTSPMYQVWTYGEGNELRSMFDSMVLGKTATSRYLQLAPDPAAMLRAVTTDSMAIGYIPRAWLRTGEVQMVTIEPELQRNFQQPNLALASTEPEGNLKSYLLCLQQSGVP